MSLVFAHDRVPEVASELPISNEAVEMAVEYATTADKSAEINKSPSVVAAASLYLSCLFVNETQTQRVVADAAGVSPVSVRNCYGKLAEVNGVAAGVARLMATRGVSPRRERKSYPTDTEALWSQR